MNDTPDFVATSEIPIEASKGPYESREFRICLLLTQTISIPRKDISRTGEPEIRKYIDPRLRESLNHRIYGQVREIARKALYGTEREMRDALEQLANYQR
jgi:hypothetical protein